jgi:hypothetical protein
MSRYDVNGQTEKKEKTHALYVGGKAWKSFNEVNEIVCLIMVFLITVNCFHFWS